MTKTFKDLQVGDSIFFVDNNNSILSLAETSIKNIYLDKDQTRVIFENDNFDFSIDMATMFRTRSESEEGTGLDTVIFTSKEEAKLFFDYKKTVIKRKFEQENKEKSTPCEDKKCECSECKSDEKKTYTVDDLFNMSTADAIKAINGMSDDELVKCESDIIKHIMNIGKCLDKMQKKPSNDGPSCKYNVPSQDQIDEAVRSKYNKNLNANGGVKSVPATLVITINEDGILSLDPEHFDKVNPLFQGPQMYFHPIEIPMFNEEDSEDECVDAVYRAIEDWIFEKYPELENLSYGEEWNYNILRNVDYVISNDKVDFNIFK